MVRSRVSTGSVRAAGVAIALLFVAGLTTAPAAVAAPQFSRVKAPDGVELVVVEDGNRDGPAILLIHGFSQSYLSWERQLKDPALLRNYRLIAFDLRGHGASGKPSAPEAYSGDAWADDVAAVIEAKGLSRVVVVAWSMGGRVAFEYVRKHGTGRLAGLNLVASSADVDPPGTPPDPPPARMAARMAVMGGLAADDLDANLAGAAAFVELLTEQPLDAAERRRVETYNAMTPAYVRRALLGSLRQDFSSLRERLTLPVFVTHGEKDAVIPAAHSARLASALPSARLSLYPGIGHAPFLEAPERFDTELAAFVDGVARR
jgi:non-heme chloroperoxidase